MNEQTQELHAVVYTDGGFKPSHVIGGWGFHGYVYLPQESKTGSGAKNFTPGPKGYLKGSVLPMPITPVEYVNGLGSITQDATNNVAELLGATRALKFVLERGVKSAHLLLDSQYVLKGLTEFIGRWEAAGWIKGDGQPVKNIDLWKELLAVKRAVEAAGVTLTLAWVRGHNKDWSDKTDGEPGNAAADELCNRACQAAINGNEIDQVRSTPAKGYWKVKSDRNRMLNLSTLLYMGQPSMGTGRTPGSYAQYHMTQIKAQTEFLRQAMQGKPVSDAQYAVVRLKEPDPVIDALLTAHNQFVLSSGRNPVVKMDLGAVTKVETYHLVNTTGTDYLILNAARHEVLLLDKTPLTVPLDPPRLTFRALDKLEMLSRHLDAYSNTPNEQPLVCFTDVTDLLYGMVEKGKKSHRKLKDRITNTTRTLDFDALYRVDATTEATRLPLSLSLALDLPDRNTLSAIAESVLKVAIVTWPESRRAIRCACIVETTDGLGIWAAPYANLHFLPSVTDSL